MESIINTNLIPKMMLDQMRQRDSLRKAKQEESQLQHQLKEMKDTLQSEDNLTIAEIKENKKNTNEPGDSNNKKQPERNNDMFLPDSVKKRMQMSRDTARTPNNQ